MEQIAGRYLSRRAALRSVLVVPGLALACLGCDGGGGGSGGGSGAGTAPAPVTMLLNAAQIQSIDIIPDPTPSIPRDQSWAKITVVVRFKVSAQNVGNRIRIRLVDDDFPSGDELIGEKLFDVPAGLAADTELAATLDFACRCSATNVAGAEDSGESIAQLKVEFESGGDNFGEGSRSITGGDPSIWPAQLVQCNSGGLWGLILGE